MTTVLLLSVEVLKKRGILGENVDVKVIVPTIEEVQDQYIHPILGTELYLDLKSRIDAGTVASGSPVYTTLLEEYIIPCMIRYVEAEIQEINTFKQSQKGTQTKSGDNSQPASIRELLALAQNRRNKAESYAQRITEYLLANQQTYPKYLTQTRTDAVYPNGTSYDTGMWLGDDYTDDDCTPREERWREKR